MTTDVCPNDCGSHCGNPAWSREDHEARADRLRPLAEHLRRGHDVPDDERRYRDTWLHIALLADEWSAEAVAAARAEAVREARDEIKTMLDGFKHRGRHTRARWAVEWLGHIANRLEQVQP